MVARALSAIVALCLPVGAAVALQNSDEVLVCDEVSKLICCECGEPPSTCLQCCDNPDCTILLNVIAEAPLIRFKVPVVSSHLNAQEAFERKAATSGGKPVVQVTLKESVVATGAARRKLSVKVQLTGADAGVGGLLYAVAFLGDGGGALDAVRALGLDVSLLGPAPSQACDSVMPGVNFCPLLAKQLSDSITASLLVGDRAEHDPFVAGVQALGFAPCETVTTTTSSTTSTTLCSGGLTDCSGTCVNLTNDINNCGACGNVCQPPNTSCIGSTCTIP
jgi:hypothetical protein